MPQETAFEIVWRNPWVRALGYGFIIICVLWLLFTYQSRYTFALQVGIIGFVIAYILNPVVNGLTKLRMGRPLAVILVYILMLNLLVLGSVIVSQVVSELGRLVSLIPTAFSNIGLLIGSVSDTVRGWLENLPAIFSEGVAEEGSSDQFSQQLADQLEVFLANAIESINSLLQRLVNEGPGLLISGATTIVSTTLQFFLILLASAYFLYDFPKFAESFKRIVPVRYRLVTQDIMRKTDTAVGGYLRGQLLITSILGVFIYIGLSIINVPLALAISFLAAIFNLVPYLGPIVGTIPAVLLGFTVSPITALWAVVVFIIANQIEGNILAPYILAKSTNLHPVTVLLSILVGAGFFGLLGALLSVPVVALVKVILDEYLLTRPAYQATPDTEVEAALQDDGESVASKPSS